MSEPTDDLEVELLCELISGTPFSCGFVEGWEREMAGMYPLIADARQAIRDMFEVGHMFGWREKAVEADDPDGEISDWAHDEWEAGFDAGGEAATAWSLRPGRIRRRAALRAALIEAEDVWESAVFGDGDG